MSVEDLIINLSTATNYSFTKGFYFFLRNNWLDYMFFQMAFAFLDYDKAIILVLIENVLMLMFWVFIGNILFLMCKNKNKSNNM